MDPVIIPPQAFKHLPWKNGQGTTCELAKSPDPHFIWRISQARVDRDGEFSDFTGYDRVLIMLEGNGMDLFHGNGQQDLLEKPFDLAKFSGAWKTHAHLRQGEIQDFNIMTDHNQCRAQVDTCATGPGLDLDVTADILLVHAPTHSTRIIAPKGETWTLPAGHLFRQDSPDSGAWSVQGEGLICIQLKMI